MVTTKKHADVKQDKIYQPTQFYKNIAYQFCGNFFTVWGV
jgi:hypothetical protein